MTDDIKKINDIEVVHICRHIQNIAVQKRFIWWFLLENIWFALETLCTLISKSDYNFENFTYLNLNPHGNYIYVDISEKIKIFNRWKQF